MVFAVSTSTRQCFMQLAAECSIGTGRVVFHRSADVLRGDLGITFDISADAADDLVAAWTQALSEMWRPILVSMLIVASGFALFSFPAFRPPNGGV
jgi:hypothetical protein